MEEFLITTFLALSGEIKLTIFILASLGAGVFVVYRVVKDKPPLQNELFTKQLEALEVERKGLMAERLARSELNEKYNKVLEDNYALRSKISELETSIKYLKMKLEQLTQALERLKQ